MSDLRKLVASAICTGIQYDENHEATHDRIAALALANTLGGKLWRLKYVNDHKEYEPVLALLTKHVRRSHEPIRLMRRLSECVLREWLDDICRTCIGRGKIVPEGTPHARHVCTACEGTGSRKPSAMARMSFMGLPYKAYPKWERVFEKVSRTIIAHDDLAWTEVAQKLGRIANRESVGARILAFARPRGKIGVGSRPAHNDNSNAGDTVERGTGT